MGENARLFQALLKQQKVVVEFVVSTQTQANAKLWEAVIYFLETQVALTPGTPGVGGPGQPATPLVRVQKMTTEDDADEFLNAFERTATVAGWAQTQWVAVLIPCLISPAQQAMDILPAGDLNDYAKVRAAILHTLNLSLEAYRRWLREIEFGPNYYPRLIAQKIRAVCLRWLRTEVHTKE